MNKRIKTSMLGSCFLLMLFLSLQTSSSGNSRISIDEKLIGFNSSGNVTLYGPIGNPNSKVKIAYIIGIHPPEFRVHDTLYSIMANKDDLNYCYYIYKINAYDYLEAKGSRDEYDGRNSSEYNDYRMEGQLFGRDFVVPDVTKKDYNMVVDFHSNHRSDTPDWSIFYGGGGYDEGNFIFSPSNESANGRNYLNSREMVDYYLSENPLIKDYVPRSQTSPSYVTILIMASGKRTLVYEAYMRDPEMYNLLRHFLDSVDSTPSQKFGVNKTTNDTTLNEQNFSSIDIVVLLIILLFLVCIGFYMIKIK